MYGKCVDLLKDAKIVKVIEFNVGVKTDAHSVTQVHIE